MTRFRFGPIAGVVIAALGIAQTFAQQPPPPAPEYTITLTGQDWFQIGEALADRPFKVANPILQKINQQVTAIALKRQKDEAEAAKTPAPSEPEKKPE